MADNYIVKHSGGHFMHHFRVSSVITILFCFVLLTFGCTTTRNQRNNTEFGITAAAVPEGILISFRNIPIDASHMWVNISTVNGAEDPESPRSIISSYAAITNTQEMDWIDSSLQLEKLRETGTMLFPFVEPGKKYYVSVDVYTLLERKQFISYDENPQWSSANTEVIAKNGIYFNRDDVRLELNNDNTAITLTYQPVFSSEVIFADQMYRFGFTVQIGDASLGVGDHHIPEGLSSDGLTWVFEPQMSTFNLRSGDWLEEGVNYPAWASAFVNIIHDEIIWSINIANTPMSNFSL